MHFFEILKGHPVRKCMGSTFHQREKSMDRNSGMDNSNMNRMQNIPIFITNWWWRGWVSTWQSDFRGQSEGESWSRHPRLRSVPHLRTLSNLSCVHHKCCVIPGTSQREYSHGSCDPRTLIFLFLLLQPEFCSWYLWAQNQRHELNLHIALYSQCWQSAQTVDWCTLDIFTPSLFQSADLIGRKQSKASQSFQDSVSPSAYPSAQVSATFLRLLMSVPLSLFLVLFPSFWGELLEMLSRVSFCWFWLSISPRASGLRWGSISEQTNSQQYVDAELVIRVWVASFLQQGVQMCLYNIEYKHAPPYPSCLL